ncbi:MAG: hypothetical protein ACI9EF_002488 [Pseudohongiellaceae bacterium]|jgi:hypothetical protein
MRHAPTRAFIHWLAAPALLLLLSASETAGSIPLAPPLLSGGGGVSPLPPKRVHHRNNPAPPVSSLDLPLLVGISGPASYYTVVVTNASGVVVASGQTNAQGMIQLTVPPLSGLELDVLDTVVVGMPVFGGQAVLITIP